MTCLGLLSSPQATALLTVSLTDCPGYLVGVSLRDDPKIDAKMAGIALGSLLDAVASVWQNVEGLVPGRFRDAKQPDRVGYVFASGGNPGQSYVPNVPYIPYHGKGSDAVPWESVSMSNEFACWMCQALTKMAKSQSGVLSFDDWTGRVMGPPKEAKAS